MFTQKLFIAGLLLLSSFITNAQNKPYKAGEIYTENIYQYGKMEVRMLAATGSGIISNFFTFKEGSELSSTFWEEIDIEVFGKDGANSWQSNLITGQGNSNLTRTEGIHQETGLGESYHTYTIEWTPTSVTWLVDGEIIRTINEGQSLLINSETSLRFNIWNPNIPQWVGPFDSNILPVHMYVNWIKFYEWNGSSFSSEPTFEDDFDNFDENTWTKANHTFAENQSDFIPENVNIENGYLVLSITKDDETGYSDTPPIDISNDNEITVLENPNAIIETNINSGIAPLNVSFDASSSNDPNNESLSYLWDFDDGNTAIGELTSNIFDNPGNYIVNLTVTNNSGLSDSTSIEIVVTNENLISTTNCSFNTPSETPLSTLNRSYTNIFVLGENGPNLDNITNFTINWDLNNNGLWQLSVNTNNGQPQWWMDLKSFSTFSFNTPNPQISLENTGINGLDGTYYVNTVGEDFILASTSEEFSIYFSYSGSEPDCDQLSAKTLFDDLNLKVYPNPSSINFTIDTINLVNHKIEIYEVSGKLIETLNTESFSTISFGENLLPGFYLLKIYDQTNEHIKTLKIIKE